MSTTEPTDVVGDARIAHAEHQKLIETVMGIIDVLDLTVSGEASPNVPELRKKIGLGMRRSIVEHSAAVAALVMDRAPDYALELVEYAETYSANPPAPDLHLVP
jgi:hypothetical protein